MEKLFRSLGWLLLSAGVPVPARSFPFYSMLADILSGTSSGYSFHEHPRAPVSKDPGDSRWKCEGTFLWRLCRLWYSAIHHRLSIDHQHNLKIGITFLFTMKASQPLGRRGGGRSWPWLNLNQLWAHLVHFLNVIRQESITRSLQIS